jgi:hypothetical protein
VPFSKRGGRSPQPEKAFHALWERLKEHPLARLGPGLITGVADDDPSGIATYSQAGAQFGLNMLWTMPLAYPLMAAIQSMCAQIGRVTGKGLAANIKTAFPPIVLKGVVLLFLIQHAEYRGRCRGHGRSRRTCQRCRSPPHDRVFCFCDAAATDFLCRITDMSFS